MTRKLFPIALRGENTSEVESFSSYIHRVAFEHGLYVGELMRFVYKYGSKEINGSGLILNKNLYLSVSELLRPGKTTKLMVDLFEKMTMQPLKSSVLWFMDAAVGRSSNEVVRGFRWCPECINEMEKLGQEPYFKLIWHMSGIVSCPLHRTPLVDACQYCGCDQTSYIKKAPINYCQQCGMRLSKRKNRLTYLDVTYSSEMLGVDLIAFFDDLSKYPNETISLDGLRESLKQLFDYYWEKESENDLYRIMPRAKLLSIIDGQRPISLKVARRFAFDSGLTLYDLLSGNAHQTTAVLGTKSIREVPPAFMYVSKKEHRDHRSILRKIRRILSVSEIPPSLASLAHDVGVSIGYIEYRYPALAMSVVKSHQEYHEHEMLKKRYLAQSVALKYFIDEQYKSHNKSRKEAYRVLRDETGLPKFMLKKAIQSAYAALN